MSWGVTGGSRLDLEVPPGHDNSFRSGSQNDVITLEGLCRDEVSVRIRLLSANTISITS